MEKLRQKEENGKETQFLQNFYSSKTKKKMQEEKCQNSNSSFFKGKWKCLFSFSEASGFAEKVCIRRKENQ